MFLIEAVLLLIFFSIFSSLSEEEASEKRGHVYSPETFLQLTSLR